MRVAHVVLSASVLAVPVALLSALISARCTAPQIAAPQIVAPQVTALPTAAPQLAAPTPQVVAPAPPAASGEEDAIRLAVFRYLVGHNASGGQSNVPFVCLEVHQGDGVRDPSPFIMAAVRGTKPRVVPGTACEHSGDGVFLKGSHTEGRGLVFRTAEVTIDGGKATVKGGYFEAGLSASGNVYTVERQRDGSWQVTKDEMRWIS